MIDTKRTLIKLHKEFPTLTLDELFKILDCITEEYHVNTYTVDKSWWELPYTVSSAHPNKALGID